MSSNPVNPLLFGASRSTAHVNNHTAQLTIDQSGMFREDPVNKSAKTFLKNVQEDDEVDSTRKRSGPLRGFGRRSPSLHDPADTTNKHYAKMGILLSEEEGSTSHTQSYSAETNNQRPALRRIHTLPNAISQGTSPKIIIDSLGPSSVDGHHPVIRDRTNSDGFVEVEPEVSVTVQPSPPISVKSNSSGNTIHGLDEQSSSPDSGYGNTPECVNGTRSNDQGSNRGRGDTDNSVFSLESDGASPHDKGMERPQLKHAQSVPDNMVNRAAAQSLGPEGAPEHTQFPFRMSIGPGVESGPSSDFGEQLQRRAHHHVNPSLPTPHQRAQAGTLPAPHQQKLEPKKRKVRASSQPFSTMADVHSLRQLKAGITTPPIDNTKDYFQVTDELAKENAHFSLSEALLSVIEQYKANRMEDAIQATPPSSPTHSALPTNWKWSPEALTPPGVQHFTGSPASPGANRYHIDSPVGSAVSGFSMVSNTADVVVDLEPPQLKPSTLSLLEIMQSPSWDYSAESTAQKLLRHMTGHMSKAGDSQLVVKVPTEFLMSLQKDEDLQRSVTTSSAHMRGNREWAPPRKQIIYSVKQPSKNILKDMASQGYRCTGCGMKIEPTFAKLFRFCNYTGKYFCQNCHINATSIIPAHILDRWSFKRHYVSNFARDLLARIYTEPVLTIATENTAIYDKVPLMAQAKELRVQLISVVQYLNTCRSQHATTLNRTFHGHAPWTIDLHTYSIEDFVEIKSGTKLKYLRSMLSDGVLHIKSCPLCMGKGFICELCDNTKDVIFPFENSKVSICKECQCCFHKACFKPSKSCPRCERMLQRLKQRAREQTKDYSDKHT